MNHYIYILRENSIVFRDSLNEWIKVNRIYFQSYSEIKIIKEIKMNGYLFIKSNVF
jgi:hypothetical protein